MNRCRRVIMLSLAILCVVAVAGVGAQQAMSPAGYVNFQFTSLGLGVGFSWGSGWLAFNGQNYPIKVEGLNIASVGLSTANAIGTVYNLVNPWDIAGTYTAVSGGLALTQGVRGTLAQNGKGVVIDIVAPEQGVSVTLGTAGFTISLQ
jgi:hypothetical protein